MEHLSPSVLETFLNDEHKESAYETLIRQVPLKALVSSLFSQEKNAEELQLLANCLDNLFEFYDVIREVISDEELMASFLTSMDNSSEIVKYFIASQIYKILMAVQHKKYNLRFLNESSNTSLIGKESCIQDLRSKFVKSPIFAYLSKLIVEADTSIAETASKSLVAAIRYDVATSVTLGSSEKSKDEDVPTIHSKTIHFSDFKQNDAVQVFLSNNFTEFLKMSALEEGHRKEEVKIRVLSLTLSIGNLHESIFAVLRNFGFFSEIVKLYKSDDLLLKLNAIELISQFSQSDSGIAFLLEEEVLETLIQDIRDSLLDDLSLQQVMSLLCDLVKHNTFDKHRRILRQNHFFAETLLTLISSSNDPARMLCGINCWSEFCVVPDDIIDESKINRALTNQVADKIKHTTNSQIACASMDSWCRVLKSFKRNNTPEGQSVTFWKFIAENVVGKVIDCLLQPFPEKKIVAFQLLYECIDCQEIAKSILSHKDFFVYLCSFSTEATASVSMQKFNFTKRLLGLYQNDLWFTSLIGAPTLKSLKSFVQSGPYYAPKDIVPDVKTQPRG